MSDHPRKEIEKYLATMEKFSASDLHLKVASPPIFRVHGVPQRMKGDPLAADKLRVMVLEMLSEKQRTTLETTGSVDFAVGIPGSGRFRINIYQQRGTLSVAARRVSGEIPNFEQLLLPKPIARIPAYEEGLALVVGVTGAGKTTTLAAILNEINHTQRVHILTIEDPIEFIHRDDKAFINQREVGTDSPDFHTALRYSLRQDPDVILVGEIRDSETMETALWAAETGHLVFGTLHATNCMQSITRILEFFPLDRQPAIRQISSYTLRAVVAQRLVPGIRPENPRVPAIEIMFVNAVIRKIIAEGEDAKLADAIRAHVRDGMQDFNMSLYRLVKEGYVSEEIAIQRSANPEQLTMQLKGMVLNSDKQTI